MPSVRGVIRYLKVTLGVLILLVLGQSEAKAFSLMGPLAPWMTTNMSYLPSDVGGPMNIDERYRWNIATVTYGFDPSFVATFGQPGIDAVEAAIAIFNDLPPSSQIDLGNYGYTTTHSNSIASSEHLIDLKSYTLSLN
ncbi:MAG: hypothetical protein JWM68_5708 [Verrucomicrobiales bacterium]|nr:hypothetical protein [Verrucomicrobiales bacterium]